MPIVLQSFPVHIVLWPESIYLFSERFSGEIRREIFSLEEKSGGYIRPHIDKFSEMKFISMTARDFQEDVKWLHSDTLCCEIDIDPYIKDGENIFDIDIVSKELIRFFAVDHGINCEVSDQRG
ncbi:MAG: hypothetical protein ACRCT1_07495 [Microcoleaceae cyanobacterium]